MDLRHYFEVELGWGRDHQSELVFKFLGQAAEAARGGVILDAGAGHQRYKPFFEECVYVAQEHPVAGAQNKDIQVYDILCDVREIPLQDDSVDAVLSTSSLEHFEYPQEFFNEAYRVIKPGGGLWVHIPFVYPEHEIPFDFQRATRYGIERWYRHAGFSNIEVVPDTSSILTATTWLQYAINEEMYRGNFSRHLPARVGRYALRETVRLMCNFLNRRFDHGPQPDTTFPTGWIATGYKPGKPPEKQAWANVQEFMAHNSKPVANTEL